MSQDRIKGEIVFICDDCDETLETETDDFAEANALRQDGGWQAYLHMGNWLHRCPDCQE